MKRNVRKSKRRAGKKWAPILGTAVVFCLAAAVLAGVLGKNEKLEEKDKHAGTQAQTGAAQDLGEEKTQEPSSGLAHESAADGRIDFVTLQEENPDIFAWLYIPGTNIDYPVLQSEEADDFYEFHDAFGKESTQGALYTELANMKDMCDFNTVIHGKTLESGDQFSKLHLFADQAFFETHEEMYLYLPDNVLTYEIFASYPREDNSLIREYDFTYMEGCARFLEDMYAAREMEKNLREGWEELTPYHFLVTLTTDSQNDTGKQFVVIAALTNDAAGKIDRAVYD